MLREGRVAVDGRTASLGDSADPQRNVVTVDGVRVESEPLAYWMLHKPRGVISTLRDTHGRPTVADVLPGDAPRLFPVGRLDRDTEGLLLLTNDGPLTHVMLHPSHAVEREYAVTVRGRMAPEALERLAAGVEIEDGPTAPARVDRVRRAASSPSTRFHLTVIEGRKRQIRRALAALGYPVQRLVRVRIGPLRLGRLPEGEARPLTPRERRALEALRSRGK